ncbi:MAG TPA: multicopper oxidase domain-containing protein, partial [Gemmatimonadaceae bacterium]|nr:multicopper oxidase domain-containing protein [Gemmatimonadaceae bacterium]
MPGLEPFRDELPIPDTVHALERDGRRGLVITAQVASARLHATLPPTTTWSYRVTDGEVVRAGRGETYLGPTIEVARGETIGVTWTNGIDADAALPFEVVRVPNADAETTIPVPQNVPGRDGALPDAQDPGRRALRDLRAALVTHLHGGRTQSYSDGWPDDTVVSGQSLHYRYQNDQSSAMLWYHDHSMHVTRLNVYAGLAGVWLVRDDEEARLSLPDGAYELPLLIQDRNLDVDDGGHFTGALLHKVEAEDGPMEFFGPYTLVNGVIWPKAAVEPRLYRLRVLNAANARTYRLSLLDESGRTVNDRLTLIG